MKRFLLILLLFLPLVYAIPESLQKVSFTVAFLGGILMFFAPCSYALVPAYLAVTFKQKSALIKSTILLFAGFISTFGFIALSTSLIGRILNIYSSYLIKISGIAFVIFAVLSLLGISFGGSSKRKFGIKTHWQIFLSGALFALGFAACTGPVFYSILALSVNLNFISSFLLVIFYSLGLFAPLFLTSYFFDKINFSKLNWVNKQLFSIGRYDIKIWNIVSFLLFLALGIIFLFYGNTSKIEELYLTTFDINYVKAYSFISDLQTNVLLQNNISSLWVIIPLLSIITFIIYKNKEKIKKVLA